MHTIIAKDSQAVAEQFAEWLAERITPGQAFHMALSGGSTPKILFAHLAQHFQDRISWEDLHLWWGDERCVPPDHADSNYKMTRELLIDKVSIPSENVHRVLGEAEPQEEAKRYSKEIEANLPKVDGIPTFDLIMLGMGSDGHTASIFPHQMELLTSKETCVVATHPESGQIRVSLSGPVINHAEKVAFLVTGTSKTEKVRAIFSGSEESKQYPAAHIQPRGELFWFL
ncbi:MAG: 6-phosphogluconolactonase, partial [Bacteroidota bacterium]